VLAVNGRDIQAWARDLVRRPATARPLHPGQTLTYQVRRHGAVHQVHVFVRRSPVDFSNVGWLSHVVAGVMVLLLAGYVFLRRPGVAAARAALIYAAVFCMTIGRVGGFTLQVHPQLGPIGALLHLVGSVESLLWPAALLHLALVLPQPPLVRHRWLLGLVYGLPSIWFGVYLGLIATGAPTTGLRAGLLRSFIILKGNVYPLVIVLVLWWGYRTAHDLQDRQRLRWVGVTIAGLLGLYVGLLVLPGEFLGRSFLPLDVESLLVVVGVISIAVAILRYRAFDLEVLVNRTLVWGGLTACVVGVYGGTLLLLGLVLERQTRPRFVLTLLATGLVALGLQPLRQRLQRVVNRWMYGERDDPAAVLARLGRQLQTAGPPGQVLDGIVATVGQAMRLPSVAIELHRSDESEVAASWGRPTGSQVAFPLVHDGQPVGRLLVASSAQAGALRSRDRRLLEVLAQQASAAVHAARLAADLEDSRAQLEQAHSRLLHAREEERRRLRRDLHDGIGPLLAGMSLQVDAARNLLGREPAGTDALLGTVRSELALAVSDVRRLVDALRPTPLDQLGLVPALREAAARFSAGAIGATSTDDGLLVLVEAPEELPRLPAAVEVAAYRIATEALTNTAKHARARHCWIRLSSNGALELEVIDDGHGQPGQPSTAGVGLGSMAQRAAELGGVCTVQFTPGAGTRVHARLPLPQP
jgi:signal transduction histidine kinase